MKIKLNRNLRMVSIAIMIILIGIISFLLYDKINNPGFKEEQISLYSYKNKADVNYEVFLRPNILFNQESLGENQIYFTEFVDYIQALFNYEFHGEKPADIAGDYEIVAVMEGYTRENEEEKIIWNKDFTILAKRNFDVSDKEIVIEEGITFDLNQYNEFADKVAEATKTRTSTRLFLYMNINLEVNTDNGIIKEKMSPRLIIPLEQSQFAVEKQQVGEKEGSIQEPIQVALPTDKKIVIYSIITGILIIALIYLVFFTSNKPSKSKLEKTLNKIFRSHGSRLVALDDEKIENCNSYYRVRTIEDLVKIADEIEKPILYRYRSNPKNITEFYIVDETSMYILDLRHLIEKAKEAVGDGEEIKKSEGQV